jgi:hypothetical protein
MKEIDYFRQAYQNPAFRRQKLSDLIYYRTVSRGMFWFFTALTVGGTVYIGVEEGWRAAAESIGQFGFPVVLLSAWSYSRHGILIAALSAMDSVEVSDPDH